MTKLYQSKEWFEKKYLNDHLNCREIADLIGGVARQTVWKRIRKLGIPIRSPKDATFIDNGNRCKISQGYVWIYKPDHIRANYKYVKRCVLILEGKLGRSLADGEFPHHIDGNRMNDDPNNLEVTNRSNHMTIHKPITYRWNNKTRQADIER